MLSKPNNIKCKPVNFTSVNIHRIIHTILQATFISTIITNCTFLISIMFLGLHVFPSFVALKNIFWILDFPVRYSWKIFFCTDRKVILTSNFGACSQSYFFLFSFLVLIFVSILSKICISCFFSRYILGEKMIKNNCLGLKETWVWQFC